MFTKLPAALRMLDLNPAGIMCICTVIAVLLSALVLPQFDKEAYADTAAWLKQINAADAALATKALAVNKADTKALNEIALAYMLGDGVKIDHRKASEYFQQSAKLGNTDAMLFYGILTHSHMRKPQEESQRWIRKAVAAGNEKALEYALNRPQYQRPDATSSRYEPDRIKQLLRAHYKSKAALGDTDDIWADLRLSKSEKLRHVQKLEQKAKGGDKLAQYLIGYRYTHNAWPAYWTFNGLTQFNEIEGTTDDESFDPSGSKYIRGIDYLKAAANAGFVPAERALSSAFRDYCNQYYDPRVTAQLQALRAQKLRRQDMAISWKKRAALQNDSASNEDLSQEYRDFRNRQSKQNNQSLEYGRCALKNGGYLAHANLASTYAQMGFTAEALDEELAALGTTRARLALDLDEMFVCADCSGRYEHSLENVAEQLWSGEGGLTDKALAKRLIVRNAATGDESANEDVGRFLEKTGNPSDALPYLLKADSARSLCEYGQIMCRGNSSAGNMQLGINALLRAKGKGSEEATVLLGDIYGFGRGVKQNQELASQYYTYAANKFHSSQSMMRMGEMYEHKDTTAATKQKAIFWYRKALHSGDRHAASKLKQLGDEDPQASKAPNSEDDYQCGSHHCR